MILFSKKETSKKEIAVDKKLKKELAFLVFKAKGRLDIEQFAKNMKLFDHAPIENLLKGNYSVLPDRGLLRKISDYSEGRISYKLLYDLCGYSEFDPEEDRSWAKWVPRWAEVYMCDLGVGEDSLQGGKRNVLIIQNNKGNQYSPNVSILPISSKCKFNPFMHILLGKELGFEMDSYALSEMPLTISKRRFFYNKIPYKITKLPDFKMKEIQVGLEKQFGFLPLYFDVEHAFELVKHIKNLENNIKIKKSHNLVDIMEGKLKELIEYCSKYKKNHQHYLQEYDRINSYAVQAI